MRKFWMMVVAIMALGLTTGCPDGDSCPPNICDECGNGFCGAEEYAGGECPEDCGSGFCGDGICEGLGAGRETCSICPDDCGTCPDGGADADADVTACTACSVAGDWSMHQLFSNGDDVPFTSHFDQDGNNVVGNATGGSAGYCDYAGTNTNGSVSLRCTSGTWWTEYNGVLTSSSHVEGNWNRYDGESGTWYGDLQ